MMRGRRWIAGLLLLVGLNAVAAGYAFIDRPDGSALGIPQEWLQGSPFPDYTVPGVLLLLLGMLCLAASAAQLLRRRLAWAWAGASGACLVVWILAQAAWMGSFRHPAQTVLQAAVLGVGLVVAALALRQYRDWHLRWGATEEEFQAAMPGDGHIPRPAFRPTRAVTIDAPPEAVWRWLVQMGYGRAGFYSIDRLDNAGRPSLDVVDPGLQGLQVGDRIPMSRKATEDTAFRVAAIDPPRSMVWTKRDSSWAWLLVPLPGGRTRLLSRIRLRYEWRSPLLPVSLLLMEVGDFVMMRRCLLGIRRRAEAEARRRRDG